MRYRLALACLAALTLGVDLAHAQCMQALKDARAEGRLTVGRFSDAAGRPETAYILRLTSNACLDGAKDEDAVKGTRRIHVFSSNEALSRRMQRLLGRKVVVFGQPLGAHTAHHHAPIVMDVSEIGPLTLAPAPKGFPRTNTSVRKRRREDRQKQAAQQL